MNPKKSEKLGKGTLAALLLAIGAATKKYGPKVAEVVKEQGPIILSKILRRG